LKNQPPTEKPSQIESVAQGSGERLVYIVPEEFVGKGDEISLRDMWEILWRRKLLVGAITAAFAIASVLFALLQVHWYRAEVLLAPADARTAPSLGAQLGGLAALAGVSVGGDGSVEALATLQSREFARAFIEEFELLPVFFADDWDEDIGQWRGPDPAEWPDIRDAVRFFHENVLRVAEDRQSLLVTMSVEWTDPVVAAQWAEALVKRLNVRLRERALSEAESNVAYLQAELAQTNVVTLQQSIGRLLESELQKLMLARGNEEFAFRVIDAAEVPKVPSRPKRTLIVVIGTLLGGVLGVLSAFVASAVSPAANGRSSA
jgi:uncharacterized protein involved in exopolysaccharide biosynthesis